MPSWNVHLAIANQINKELKLDKNAFYLGNLLPDVDYGMKKTRHETHYYDVICPGCPSEKLPNYKEFIKHNKNKLSSPLILGELVHIMADYYYNNKIYVKYWVQDENNNIIGIRLLKNRIIYFDSSDISDRKWYKHHDLELYGKYLFKKDMIEMPEYNNVVKGQSKFTIYTNDELIKRCEYLNNEYKKRSKYTLKERIFGLKYKMISKEDLDLMFNECIDFVLKEIKGLTK